MMDCIWGGMLLIGIVYAAVFGNFSAITGTVLGSAKSAVTLGITMAGAVAFWSGLMRVAERSGLISSLTEMMERPLRALFPKIPKNHPANKYIAANFIANILGLGWAATPAGLSAMRELHQLNRERQIASNEMCLFMVINMSSLQLISVNLLAYRAEYHSVNPSEIIGPGIIATFLTTIVGILICKIAEKV